MTAAAGDRWALPALSVGEFAPDVVAETHGNPHYSLTTVAGRYVLVVILPRDPAGRDAALGAFETIRPRADDRFLTAFFVTAEPREGTQAVERLPGQRWFFDPDGAVARRFHASAAEPTWFLFDPGLRLMARGPLDEVAAMTAAVASLPPVAEHAGTPLVAPVLIVPRVFSPQLCRQLIDLYETAGGEVSGVMRDVAGRTVGVLDGMKRRRDAVIEDEALRRDLSGRIQRFLLPMIRRTFNFNPTRIERYIVACYDAAEGGYFNAHRDNETLGTAHRRFACSINLNAEDFDGGDLQFPEYGPRTYRPPTGGGVVFACGVQHAATPVTRGRRYAFLPFLYDEAGQQIRDANAAFLAKGQGAVIDNR